MLVGDHILLPLDVQYSERRVGVDQSNIVHVKHLEQLLN